MACFGLRSLRWTPARVERHYSSCTNLLDLPLCVLEEIVDCVIAPLQHVGTEAKFATEARTLPTRSRSARSASHAPPLPQSGDQGHLEESARAELAASSDYVGPDSPGLVCRPAVEGGCLLATPSPRGPS